MDACNRCGKGLGFQEDNTGPQVAIHLDTGEWLCDDGYGRVLGAPPYHSPDKPHVEEDPELTPERELADWRMLSSAVSFRGVTGEQIWPNNWHQDCSAVAFLIDIGEKDRESLKAKIKEVSNSRRHLLGLIHGISKAVQRDQNKETVLMAVERVCRERDRYRDIVNAKPAEEAAQVAEWTDERK